MTKSLYDKDFNLWLEQTIQSLKEGKFEDVDLSNLVDEIEGMVKRDKRALLSDLRIVLLHLLKCKYQPEKITTSWIGSIEEHRNRIYDILADSPSLNRYLEEEFTKVYQRARKQASKETQKPLNIFPVECPFTQEQVLEDDYLPGLENS